MGGEKGASSSAASRFAYDMLTVEDEAAKAPGAKRGKDGHLTIGGSGGDFFSNPMGKPASVSTSRCAALIWSAAGGGGGGLAPVFWQLDLVAGLS